MIRIKRCNSNSIDFKNLITLLDSELNSRYGIIQKSYHYYNKIDFIDTVVVGYYENEPVSCGCFKIMDTDSVEIKRMFVKPEFRGRGVAIKTLSELEAWAVENGFSKGMLETGILQPEAINLYKKGGYQTIENYGQYIGNSNSVCMQKELL